MYREVTHVSSKKTHRILKKKNWAMISIFLIFQKIFMS